MLLAGSFEALAQSFTYTGSMASRRVYHTATLLDSGQVLVAGGEFKGHYGLNTAELYNANTGAFSSTGTLNTGRERHTATLLHNGEVLIVGGQYVQFSTSGSQYICLASAELYDPNTGKSADTGSLKTARCANFTATLLDDGTVLVVGGYNSGGIVAGAELYNPSTGTFTSVGSPQVSRAAHAAALLPNGDVLIAGGGNATTTFSSAEL